jgi:hypothetical protein
MVGGVGKRDIHRTVLGGKSLMFLRRYSSVWCPNLLFGFCPLTLVLGFIE